MSWLFWILLILPAVLMIQGFRKGLVRTVVSMVSFLLVMAASSWLNPYVGDFIREKTTWQADIQQGCQEILFAEIEKQIDISGVSQNDFIEELPLPQGMKNKLIQNNTAEMYRQLAVENFTDYVSGYIAYGIINGIAFIASFLLAIIIIKVVMYAVDILTELPVISLMNRLGGLALGLVQGILWIWIIFFLIALLCNTTPGIYLMNLIQSDPVLSVLYNYNLLYNIVMYFVI
ncbi:MAG: CvpA family protein [Oliverpabstia sp.]